MIERIIGLLNERGITQKELASAIGISTGNVSDWKIGRAKPSVDVLVKIADYFGVTVDYLVGRSEVRNLDGFTEVQDSGVIRWLNDRLFSAPEQKALKDHFLDMLTKYKMLLNELAVRNRSQARKTFVSEHQDFSELSVDTCESVKRQLLDLLQSAARFPCDFNLSIVPDGIVSPSLSTAIHDIVGLLPEGSVRGVVLSEDEYDLIGIWNSLDKDGKRIILGLATEQKQRMAAESEKNQTA